MLGIVGKVIVLSITQGLGDKLVNESDNDLREETGQVKTLIEFASSSAIK